MEVLIVADCPVCGMDVDESDPPERTEDEGDAYYFCGTGCAEDFENEPEQYA
jgi:YHS domain-containing protein